MCGGGKAERGCKYPESMGQCPINPDGPTSTEDILAYGLVKKELLLSVVHVNELLRTNPMLQMFKMISSKKCCNLSNTMNAINRVYYHLPSDYMALDTEYGIATK
ncbi:UNVERIFIED_CONTAM: hypothetical protein K2H54_035651 [Gekko kuhli]